MKNAAVSKTLTITEQEEAANKDRALQGLRHAIRLNRWDRDAVRPLKSLRNELTMDGHNLILRSNRIAIPTSLQQHAIDLAHAIHQ